MNRSCSQTSEFAVKAMGGQWAGVVDKAVAEFNRQMSKIGLKLVLAKVEKGKLYLKTDYAGTVAIAWSKVVAVDSRSNEPN